MPTTRSGRKVKQSVKAQEHAASNAIKRAQAARTRNTRNAMIALTRGLGKIHVAARPGIHGLAAAPTAAAPIQPLNAPLFAAPRFIAPAPAAQVAAQVAVQSAAQAQAAAEVAVRAAQAESDHEMNTLMRNFKGVKVGGRKTRRSKRKSRR